MLSECYVKVYQIDLDRNVKNRENKVECFYGFFSVVLIEVSKTKAAIVAEFTRSSNSVP